MVDYQALGQRIKARRKERHLSQLDVAKAAQISPSYYGNLERGARIPSLDTLVVIANILDIGMDYLLCDSMHITARKRSAEEIRVLSRYLRDQVAELQYSDMELQVDDESE